MRNPPTTSTTLLRVIGSNPQSARWAEFIEKYEPLMIGVVRKTRPDINDNEMEDVLQEVMMALMKLLPNYHYAPDEKGHFRNYLFGVCRKVTMAFARKRIRFNDRIDVRSDIETRSDEDGDDVPALDVAQWFVDDWRKKREKEEGEDYKKWQESVLEVALQQLMADPKILSQHKEIFRLLAVDCEKSPEDVAKMFNLTRNNVDQIKNRMKGKLRELASALRNVGMADSKS